MKKSSLTRAGNCTAPKMANNKRKIIRKVLLFFCALIFVFGVCLVIYNYSGTFKNEFENNNLRGIHSSTASTSSSSSSPTTKKHAKSHEFTSLSRINKDIKGWITIPGTNIDYPVVQSSDNAKYLHVDFYKQKERHGTLFLDYRDKIKPMSQDLIIYGHNMDDGQMFSQLCKYERMDGNDYVAFYNTSPVITFDTTYEKSKWKIFAVFVTTADSTYAGSIYYLNTQFYSTELFNSFVSDVRKRSFVNTKVDVKPTDTLLTLSTCDYVYPTTKKDGQYARLVVMARKVRSGESDAVSPATENKDAVFPNYYYEVWNNQK